MMLYPAMNVLTSVIPNRYLLVNVVAHRAREIAEKADEAGERLPEKPVTRVSVRSWGSSASVRPSFPWRAMRAL